MTHYIIQNMISSVVLGIYDADSPSSALDAMAIDVGYKNYSDLDLASPSKPGEISVTEASIAEIEEYGT